MKKEKLKIFYEDKHIIIVYKKSGLPTIKVDNNPINLYSKVYDYLHTKKERVFVVHRLDRDTSGIVVFAKDEKTKNILQEQWDYVIRKYIAIVHGNLNESKKIESYLKETKTLLTYSTKDKSGKYACTYYDVIDKSRQYSMLNIEIKTGRKNQIRVHMKDNNSPILGDKKYGKKDGFRNMLLNANYISFIHPITKERIEVDTGIPTEFVSVLNNDRK